MLLNSPERFFAQSRGRPTSAAADMLSNNQLPQLDAVIIRNLTYEVGRGTKRKKILNEINLTVPEGSIYGLLGPSGCGKTTMLKCVVGRIWPKGGSVLVFGCAPTDGQGQVPGRHVGYMPQEISIYEDFTIEETLVYFGKINRMRPSEIRKRIEFLVEFLDLPSRRRTVTNLSGGQKRRVSLAAALVHSPPLLILDEPTVGVDPLLRQNIWQHLVTLTKTERISVIITTHYIEEARLANVVGLMRNGKILAEDSPNRLMDEHRLSNLEDVFLKLCVTDSSLARQLSQAKRANSKARNRQPPTVGAASAPSQASAGDGGGDADDFGQANKASLDSKRLVASIMTRPTSWTESQGAKTKAGAQITIHTATNRIEVGAADEAIGYVNEAVENFSSEDDEEDIARKIAPPLAELAGTQRLRFRNGRPELQRADSSFRSKSRQVAPATQAAPSKLDTNEYLALQALQWASRRSNALSLAKMGLGAARGPYDGLDGRRRPPRADSGELAQWLKTLLAVTWKNYVRLRRNPPVLVFQFMLPAIQVILFCLCIGGEPFDVPVAVVNEEAVPKASLQFLNGLNKKIIRQIRYDNLSTAIEAVRRGKVWGAIHIPDRYSENLQSRLILGEEVTNETISNGTIRVYPDLTNLHLALALETSFRETFINFARDSIGELGYDKSLADLPIQMGKPVYGTLRKDGYLEFMAPGVVISICYVMATGLTALAFILERRDGLLERSLVSGVQTSQILLAHAINQVVVMIIQIFLVLGCTFFIFEIPSRGPFFWVVLLILLQGCTGMGFGLLVSAICAEENTAVMMVVGTFYTNLILAGIIWPIEAMPHWLRPLSYAQPQTLPTDSLRHILSRGWGVLEPAVALGFAVTIGWLAVFLIAAGVIFKYTP